MLEDEPALRFVNCEPTSPRDAARAERMLRERSALERQVHGDNRNAALRMAGDAYFTRCACGWSGLRVADPEVARREYDVHSCRMTGEVGVRLHRGPDALPADWADETKQQLAVRQGELDSVVTLIAEDRRLQDEFEQRVQMLEMK